MTRFEHLADALIAHVAKRPPDFVIGGDENPYMLRWWLTPWSRLYRHAPPGTKSLWQRFVTALPGVYLHHIVRSDDDRALHDHPWPNVSVLLRNSYTEHTIAAGGIHQRAHRKPGDVVFRRARHAHRIETDCGACWSLFFFGFRIREWGFHCPERGWVHWRVFTNTIEGVSSDVGEGCGA